MHKIFGNLNLTLDDSFGHLAFAVCDVFLFYVLFVNPFLNQTDIVSFV